MPWTVRETRKGKVYERSLGLNELAFYHRGHVLQGATDILQEVCIDTVDEFDQDTVEKAWRAAKQKYPLLGASINVVGPAARDQDIHFIVDSHRLEESIPGEILWLSAASEKDVNTFTDNVVNGKRLLDDTFLARLFVLKRLDRPNCYHLVMHAAHCITDAISHFSVLRFMLERLSTNVVESHHEDDDLPSRLALSVANEDIFPIRKHNQARQRWHRAIGYAMFQLRSSRMKGGHTLPGNFTSHGVLKPAHSRVARTNLTVAESKAVIETCRKYGFTFGNAFPVIGQLAMARVLAQRYSRGLISDEEWQWRQREPCWTGGPINLRTYLDDKWYSEGGAETVMLAIGFYFHQLPFIPLRLAQDGSVPHFEAFLPLARFIHRCRMIKKQADDYMRHPLLPEIVFARFPGMIQDIKNVEMMTRAPFPKDEDHPVTQREMAMTAPLFAVAGSSMGRLDGLLPRSYPTSQHAAPTIQVVSISNRLRCRPGEIYLGAASYNSIMTMGVVWDNNVTSEDVILEWLAEVKATTLFYLRGDTAAVAKP